MASNPYNIEYPLDLPGNAHSPLGMNLMTNVSYASGWGFVDAWKHARAWISQRPGQPWGEGGPLDLDENGWVRSLAVDQYVENVIMDSHGHYPAGRYTVLYDGEGTMIWRQDARVVSEAPGRMELEVSPSTTGMWVRITETDPGNHIRNIRVIMPGFEDTFERQPFHPLFLELLKGYKVLRYMNWLRVNDLPASRWNERTTPQSAHQENGVAPEYIVALSNILGADAWINIPHAADDEFVEQTARLLGDGLNPQLKIYVEYSNEVWNGQFVQAGYAAEQGLALNLSSEWGEAQQRFYAQRTVEIFEIFQSVFGSIDRLVRVIAWQSVGVERTRQMLLWNNAYEQADALAIAPYIGGELGLAETQEEIAGLTVDQILDRLQADTPFVMANVKQHVVQATELGLDLIAYEGGQHLAGVGEAQNNEILTEKFMAANRHPRMQQIYLEYLTRWRQAGGKTFCIYRNMGTYGRSGSWGILEHYGQDPLLVPKYRAVKQFNETVGRWWEQPAELPPAEGECLIDFNAEALATDGIFNRALEEVTTEEIVTGSRAAFTTEAGSPFFSTGDYYQGHFYGGYGSDFTPHPQPEAPVLQLRSNDEGYAPNRFHVRIGGDRDTPSNQTALFLWKAEDFLGEAQPYSLGRLSVELGELGTHLAQLRFVVRNGVEYFISEYAACTAGLHTLDGLNNSPLPDHRWASFHPVPDDFGIPENIVTFEPVVFDDVREVGFVFCGRKHGYHHNFQFIRFHAHAEAGEDLRVTITRAPGQSWLANTTPIIFNVVFNKPVAGFTAGDLVLSGTARNTECAVSEIAPYDLTTYRLEVSGMISKGSVIVSVPAGAATIAGMPNRPSISSDNYVYYSGSTESVHETRELIGLVKNGRMHILRPPEMAGRDVRLTRMGMQVSATPEMEMIDLSEYENRAVMVRGNESGDWIYDAELIETSGPILSAVVREVMAE